MTTKKTFLINMPKTMWDKLEILMFEQMQKRARRLDMTKFLVEILHDYLKENGQHTEQIARDRIVEGVNRATRILKEGKPNKTIAYHWIDTLRPYRFNLARDDPLDKRITRLIANFEAITTQESKIWKSLES